MATAGFFRGASGMHIRDTLGLCLSRVLPLLRPWRVSGQDHAPDLCYEVNNGILWIPDETAFTFSGMHIRIHTAVSNRNYYPNACSVGFQNIVGPEIDYQKVMKRLTDSVTGKISMYLGLMNTAQKEKNDPEIWLRIQEASLMGMGTTIQSNSFVVTSQVLFTAYTLPELVSKPDM